jgi:hypothetical protein
LKGQEIFLSEEELQGIINKLVKNLSGFRRIPITTHRLQLNQRFKFVDAKLIVSSLNELGILDCYASPYFKAQKGSLHGYDILDHNTLEDHNERI